MVKKATKTHYIYKISNTVNDKVYIGCSVSPQKRLSQHCSNDSDTVISKAIKEIGKDKFTIEILDSTTDFFEAYYILEFYYIGKYQSDKTGYNGSIKTTRPPFYAVMKKFFLKTFISVKGNK